MRIVKPAPVRREEILDCAQKLFATRGYERTSVNEIVAALRISKGALYHHFASKEDLLEALTVRITQQVAHQAEDILADPSLDPFERLTAFLRRSRGQRAEMADQVRAMYAPVFRRDNTQLYHRTMAAVTGIIQPILARIIAEGVADRTFDTSDPDAAATVILQLMVTTHEYIGEAFAAPTPAAMAAVLARLVERLNFIGTVVDRILGIPEGSIRLTEPEEVALLSASFGAPPAAA